MNCTFSEARALSTCIPDCYTKVSTGLNFWSLTLKKGEERQATQPHAEEKPADGAGSNYKGAGNSRGGHALKEVD